MELYTLNADFRREEVIDVFESLIWTERFSSLGDFELKIPSTFDNRALLTDGTRVVCNNSHRVMTIHTTQSERTEDGRNILTVRGSSLESVLTERAAPGITTGTGLPIVGKWYKTGLPAVVARALFHDYFVVGLLDTNDANTLIGEGSFLPASTLPEPSSSVKIELDSVTLYENLKVVCELYGLGFRIIRDPLTAELWFEVYSGSNRTTAQTTFDPVVFSPNLNNLKNTNELTTSALLKTVAYVISPAGFVKVTAPDVSGSVTGLDRKILIVKADDVQAGADDWLNILTKRGLAELNSHRKLSAFDGELSLSGQYKYLVDYNLGDLVEMRNDDGVMNIMRVTEQIFSQDRSGERSYPTLTFQRFVEPGTWLSWEFNQTWADMDAEVWADL